MTLTTINFNKIKEYLRGSDPSYLIIAFMVAIMPIFNSYLPPFIILLVIIWVYEKKFNSAFILHPVNLSLILFFLFVSYFMSLVISAFYSSNTSFAWSSIFGRITFLLSPLVLINPNVKIKQSVFKLLKIFVLITIVHLLICYYYAFFNSINIIGGKVIFNSRPNPWISYFHYLDFSFLMHPTYLAIYVVFSVFISLECVFDKSLSFRNRKYWFFCSLFLTTSIYFISSRAGILAIILLLPLYFFSRLNNSKFAKKAWMISLLLFMMSLPLLLTNQRVAKTFSTHYHNHDPINKSEDERLIVWKAALTLIGKNIPFGLGVGDVGDNLINEYEQIGASRMAELRFNAHNQFLETCLESGLIGLLFFVAIIMMMIYISVVEENILLSIFIMMMVIFFSFETVLYRFAGISFFSTFSFLLIYYNKKNEIVIET